MKTIILASLLSLFINGAFTQKAQAGLLLFGTGLALDDTSNPNGSSGPALFGYISGVWLITAGTLVGGTITIFNPRLGIKIFLSSIVLDVDGSLAKEQLKIALNENYPFIDNDEVVTDLASAIKNKFSQNKNEENKAYVFLTKEETLRILAPADLSPELLSQVVYDLKE